MNATEILIYSTKIKCATFKLSFIYLLQMGFMYTCANLIEFVDFHPQ